MNFNILEVGEGSALLMSDLTRGAFSGKETHLYYDSAEIWATPVWVEIPRARNIQRNRGPALSDVEFHGSPETAQLPGYRAFNGSFEYVRKRGTDDVWDFLETARDAGKIVHLMHLNGPETDPNSKGWKAPVLLGEMSGVANGGDPATETIPFGLADAYDVGENQIGVEPATGTAPGP